MRDLEVGLAGALDPVAARFRWLPGPAVRWLHRRGILLNRDACRSPMQWTSGPDAGFAAPGARPWLPVHPCAAAINVKAQQEDPGSLLALHRRLLALRRERPALRAGSLELVDRGRLPPPVLGYARIFGGERIEVRLNCEPVEVTVDVGAGAIALLASDGARPQALEARCRLAPYEAVVYERAR